MGTMSKPVMVCMGKAGQDTFLEGEVFKPQKQNGVLYEHIKLGEKFYVNNATFSPGGNAANAAVTFARQHLHTKFISAMGDDVTGHSILASLDKENIDSSAATLMKDKRTSFSTILLSPTGERTILDYPGTSKLSAEAISLEEVDCDWLYVSSLGSMKLLEQVMKTAHSKNIAIAFNPAHYELDHLQQCSDLLRYVTLFAVNKEEARLFVEAATIQDLAMKLSRSVQYVLVSDGPRGAVATDGVNLVSAGMYEDVAVVDRTGAGDAFTSGFVAKIAQGKSLEEAIVFASANSTHVVAQIGGQTGILRGTPELHSMPIKVTSVGP